MKKLHDSQNLVIEKCKYITLIGRDQPQFDRVNIFIKAVYDIPENEGCFIFNTIPNQEEELIELRNKYPDTKFILYNFEQIHESNIWMNVKQYLWRTKHYMNEVWCYTPSSTKNIREAGIPCLFKPIYFIPELKLIPNLSKEIDLVFVGALSDTRCTQLRNITAALDYNMSVVMATGFSGQRYYDLLGHSKCMLNIHGMKIVDQECERLTFHIGNGIPVISQISKPNYFEGLLYEYKSTREVPKLVNKIHDEYDQIVLETTSKFQMISKELLNSVPKVHGIEGGSDLDINGWKYKNYL